MEHPVREHERAFDDLKSTTKELRQSLDKVRMEGAERLTRIETQHTEFKKRLDNRDEEFKILNRLVMGVENLAEDVKILVEKVDTHDKQLTDLHVRPYKKVYDLWNVVIVSLVTGIAGIWLTLVFSGVIGK